MKDEQQAAEEVVIKEYPKSTFWLEGRQVRAVGNLVLTNERLLFLRQVVLSQQEIETLQKLSKEASTSKLLQFALSLHKKNFQLPLSSIVSAKMGLNSILPIRPCLRVYYRSASKKEKTESFLFNVPILKRLLMSEFPTLGWTRAVNKAVKARNQPLKH